MEFTGWAKKGQRGPRCLMSGQVQGPGKAVYYPVVPGHLSGTIRYMALHFGKTVIAVMMVSVFVLALVLIVLYRKSAPVSMLNTWAARTSKTLTW